MRKLFLFLFPVAFTVGVAYGDVTLPPLISDNMLLQRSNAAVWGKADAGEAVTVTLGESVGKATADKDGNWRVTLAGLDPSLEGAMTVSGKNTLTVQNVAVGDVWVCSGQSNMEMTLMKGPWCFNGGVTNAEAEVAAANFPKIRMFIVPNTSSETPLEEVAGKWEVCTPETVPHWSAIGYFFGRQLHQDLGLPIGLIHSSVGATVADSWTPTEVLQGDPDFKSAYYDKWQEDLAKYEKESLPAWEAAVAAAKAAGEPAPKKPKIRRPGVPGKNGGASTLYNGMIAGATKYAITGAIWHQGESNVADAARYRRLLPAMITSWRNAWGQGDFPFYIVQLANLRAVRPEPSYSKMSDLRDAQRFTANTLPNCGLAVSIDIGETDNIHPRNKQDVGYRLALIAEAKTYGKDIVFSGPDFDAVKFDGESATITFRPGTAVGLVTKDGGPVKGFAIAGEDRKFVWADAKIIAADQASKSGNAISQEALLVVTSPQVPKPVAVRYAWAANLEVNLVNAAGLPAVPFRSDDWLQSERGATAKAPAGAANAADE